MAKPRGVYAKLTRLHAMRNQPVTDDVVEILAESLSDASNLVVAEAAAIVAAQIVKTLTPNLVAAFERMMIDPEENDKQCRAKIAIVEALNALEYSESEVFLRALVHVQEPRFKEPTQDAAGVLRAHAALGLARIGHPGLVLLLTERLFDTDNAARTGIVRAFAGTGSLTAVPLLRYKALCGDQIPEVMGECFASLLALAPDDSVEFVGRFLRSRNEEVQSAAVLALAETRRVDAFSLLEKFWPRASADLRESVLIGMAMFRLPSAYDFLISLVAQKDPSARSAVSALAIHRHNTKLKDRVAAAVESHGDDALKQWFDRKFAETA